MSHTHAGEAAWREIAVGVDVGVFEDHKWVGVGVFPDAVDALRFALLVHVRIPTIALAISSGAVLGGTDGRTVRVWGSAVETAIRWLPGPGRAPDQGVGRLRHVGGWLTGPGVTVDSLAMDAIQEGRVRRGLTTGAGRVEGGGAHQCPARRLEGAATGEARSLRPAPSKHAHLSGHRQEIDRS